MKSKNIAFFLNFLLTGAGFLYLRRWKLAALNFGIALLIGFTAAFLLPEAVMNQYGVHLVATGIGAGSGGWAMKTAEEMNKEEEGDVESEAYPEKES